MNSRSDEVLREFLWRWAQKLIEYRMFHIKERMSLCESPIEEILFSGLAASECFGDEHPLLVGKTPFICTLPKRAADPGDCYWAIHQQVKVDEFRVDLLVEVCPCHARKPYWLVIECDGHEFHERTKEQAARDRSRDRALTLKGYTVMRFTGSEIYRNPERCIDDVLKVIQAFERDAWEHSDLKRELDGSD